MKKLLAVTGCPTGIAHTFMAAESLQQAAKAKDVSIKVETRGASGVENRITDEDLQEAHAVIICSDVDAEEERFHQLPIVRASLSEAIKNAQQVLDEALQKEPAEKMEKQAPPSTGSDRSKGQQNRIYKHLMNGVSFMIPLVVAGGLIIALSFAFGGIHGAEQEGSLAAGLMKIGAEGAFALMVPILAGYIAFSIADKAGLTPGLVGGMLASNLGAGFLGGIVAGFLAGYIAKGVKDYLPLPKSMEKLKPVLIIPLLGTLAVGLLMVFVVGTPVKALMDSLTAWLKSMGSGNAAVLGLILGAMMSFDMGGPINKAAYTFSVGLLESGIHGPMAATMAAGMVPPLALWLATLWARRKFTEEEREAGKAAGILGLSFITEGAIPFAAADPLRVIPSLVAGSAVTGGLAMMLDVTLRAPHGGVFVLPIPHAVGNVGGFVLALVAGVLISAILVTLLKRNVLNQEEKTDETA